MTTERTLKRWRREALESNATNVIDSIENPDPDTIVKMRDWEELNRRILILTDVYLS